MKSLERFPDLKMLATRGSGYRVGKWELCEWRGEATIVTGNLKDSSVMRDNMRRISRVHFMFVS